MIRRFKTVMGGLVPAFPEDREWLEKKPLGTLIEAPFKEPRNGKLLRKWWALCGYLAEHHSGFPNSEKASKWMLRQLGYYTEVRTSRGVEKIEDSISFAKMDEEDFSKLYDKACDLLCEIIPHVTNEQVKQVLAEFAGVGWMVDKEIRDE